MLDCNGMFCKKNDKKNKKFFKNGSFWTICYVDLKN